MRYRSLQVENIKKLKAIIVMLNCKVFRPVQVARLDIILLRLKLAMITSHGTIFSQ